MSVRTTENKLGAFLKDRRTKVDPAALGFSLARRRTPGLRREEVAQRAKVSATWYTWLEQGRGGSASPEVLDRIARALILTETEREHLFLLGLGRPPEPRYKAVDGITPRLQRVLDALETCPAVIRTATWDIVAWNRAAAAVLGDYGKMEASQRNILRLMFSHARVRHAQTEWQSVARFVVAAFRAETTRAGATKNVQSLVDDLCNASPEFKKMWQENDVQGHGGGTKQLRHPDVGLITVEYSAFAVDGRPDLTLVIYNPISAEDEKRVRSLMKAKKGRK
jgi:transcriptional regulator with XRE-family HTH domain